LGDARGFNYLLRRFLTFKSKGGSTMKVNITKLAVIVVITVITTFIMTAMASAGSLKTQGQYVSTGSGTCLIALKGFNGDTGVPTLIGTTGLGWTIQTFTSEGVWIFERDGTGSFTGLNRSVTLPYSLPTPPAGVIVAYPPSAGAHTVSFNFQYDVTDGTISITADTGTYVIDWIYGPLSDPPYTSSTYHLDGFSRTGVITPDGKTITLNGGVPDKMTFIPTTGDGTMPSGAQNICNGAYVLIWQNHVNP
jgi:hypothetical protein